MIKITKDLDLRGVKVRVCNSFVARLQGSWKYSHLWKDFWLEVEWSDVPITKVLAQDCEIIEERVESDPMEFADWGRK